MLSQNLKKERSKSPEGSCNIYILWCEHPQRKKEKNQIKWTNKWIDNEEKQSKAARVVLFWEPESSRQSSAAQHVAHWQTNSHARSISLSRCLRHALRASLSPQFPPGNRKYTNILAMQKRKKQHSTDSGHTIHSPKAFSGGLLLRGGICFLSPLHNVKWVNSLTMSVMRIFLRDSEYVETLRRTCFDSARQVVSFFIFILL